MLIVLSIWHTDNEPRSNAETVRNVTGTYILAYNEDSFE